MVHPARQRDVVNCSMHTSTAQLLAITIQDLWIEFPILRPIGVKRLELQYQAISCVGHKPEISCANRYRLRFYPPHYRCDCLALVVGGPTRCHCDKQTSTDDPDRDPMIHMGVLC